MNRIFLLIMIISLVIIQCGSKTDTNNGEVNTNESIESNKTIPATKILSQEDAAFLDKVKNNHYIITNENEQTVTNIQSTDVSKMILEENQYVEPYCGIGSYTLDYEEIVGADGGYIISIQPINADTIMVTEPNGSYGFTGIYKKSPEQIDFNDKSTKEKAYYNACKWYAKNYDEINEAFNKIVEFNFESGGYYEVNMGNVNDYISKFRESGYFSDNYITSLENSFEEIKKNLEENKQNDGAPEGMDADWFLATQEIDYYLDIINNQMKLDDITIYSDDDNVLCISNDDMGKFLILELKQYGDEWLIEK